MVARQPRQHRGLGGPESLPPDPFGWPSDQPADVLVGEIGVDDDGQQFVQQLLAVLPGLAALGQHVAHLALRLVQRELAQPFVQVQRAARGAGVGSGIAFEDGDGVIMAVQDAGEGKAGRAAPDYGDAVSHVDTLYFPITMHRNSTV